MLTETMATAGTPFTLRLNRAKLYAWEWAEEPNPSSTRGASTRPPAGGVQVMADGCGTDRIGFATATAKSAKRADQARARGARPPMDAANGSASTWLSTAELGTGVSYA